MTSKQQSKKEAKALAGRNTWPLVKRVIRDYLVRHWLRIILAILLLAVVSMATAAIPFLLKDILDGAFEGLAAVSKATGWFDTVIVGVFDNDPKINKLYFLILAIVFVFVLKGFATYGAEILMAFVGHRTIANIQDKMFGRLMRADLSYFHNTATGNLISGFNNDVTKMRTLFSDTVIGIGRDVVTVIALVGSMFYLDWILSSISFFVFPLAAIPIYHLGRKMRKVSANTQEELAQFTILLEESFQGARHVKAYGMEDYEAGRARNVVERIFKLNFRASRVRAIAEPLLEIIAGFAIAGVLLYGGFQVLDGHRTPGDFAAFLAALLLAYDPVRKLARLNAALQDGLAAAERVFKTLDLKPTIVDKPDAQTLPTSKGDVQFDNVTFAYGGTAPALNGITLDVPAGKTIALVGPSGAGKTTVLNLIPRFYDVNGGSIRIDGFDVRDATLASLRENIGLVSQETSLFDDTIRANIAYGKPDAGDEEIIAAAKAAAAHDFIQEFPNGYETRVGGMGAKISGGQRQRISIARAILRNAPILLLDEATSSLDTESERQVQAALAELMKGRTTIVIAHRLSTITDADVIYVLEDGQVVEHGSHKQLMKAGGAYARLRTVQEGDGTKEASGQNLG